MNAEPHVHQVVVHDHKSWWRVSYGDQYVTPGKPRFRDPKKVLAAAIRSVIKKHDKASVRAGHNAIDIGALIPVLQPNRWGSEQLK